MKLKLLITLIASVFLLLPANAQRIGRQFSGFSTEHGLSQNTVSSVFQDSRGFMWFCTRDGLSRFDGYRFKVYRYEPGNPHSLSGSFTSVITEDRDGNLWVGNVSNQGLNRYDRKTDRFTHFKHDEKDPNSLSDNTIHSILTDKEGFIWIATRASGLDRLDPRTNRFTHFRHNPKDPNTLSTDRMASVYEGRNGDIWAGTIMGGVNRLDRKTGKVTRWMIDSTIADANVVLSVCEDRTGVVWLGTGAGVYQLDLKTNQVSRAPQLASVTTRAYSMIENKKGELWIAARPGVTVLDPSRKHVTSYSPKSQERGSLSDPYITKLYEDRSGITWMGTYSSGINLHDPKGEKFPTYRFGPSQRENPGGNSVMAVHEDPQGDLWVSLRTEGVKRYNRKTGAITTYRNNPADPKSLSANIVNCFFTDREGTLWMGTEHGGMSRFNRETNDFTQYLPNPANPDDPKSIGHNWILAICEDGPDGLWLATNNTGLDRMDKRTGTFTHIHHDPKKPDGLKSNFIITLHNDDDGALWVGTIDDGFSRRDPKTGKFTHFQHDPKNPKSLSYNNIASFYEDSKGNFWVGTWGGGLDKMDRRTGTFTHYKEADGLPSNSIFGILEDNHHRLWLSTPKGLCKFDPATGKTKNYDIHDGLQGNEFNALGASFKSNRGELFFGGTNGLNAFFPDSIRENTFVPPVRIVDFSILNKSVETTEESGEKKPKGYVLPSHISELDSIELSYKNNVFSFEFAALSFTDTEENQYAYKMEGFDDDWIYSGDRRFVTYTNLDPGEYTFRVKASNNDGTWNEQGEAIHVSILPPPWRTWWAYVLYALAGLGILAGLRKYWQHQERLETDLKLKEVESKQLHEMDQLKTRFFTNISHEFRTPLTLILSPLEQLLSRQVPEAEVQHKHRLMHRHAHRLLQLINQLLDISKLEAGSMKLEASHYDLVRFLRPVVFSFSSLAESRHLKLQFQADTQPIEAWFDADKLEKIVTNLLSNALKFTPEEGEVQVNISQEPGTRKHPAGFAVISVSDTGIGIPADRLNQVFNRFYQVDGSHTREQEGTGIGLALVKELVQLHQGEIMVDSEPGKGTQFRIKLPLGKAHLRQENLVTGPVSYEESQSSRLETEALTAPDREEQLEKAGQPVMLIVEDNADLREYIRSNFEKDYRVLEAENGQQGLEVAQEQVPDLIISDLMMPKMDGVELCRRIKTDERTSHIPVVLLTAKAAVENKIEGLETGADDYITKPFQPQELQLRVRNLIHQRQKLRERFGREVKIELSEIAVTSADEQFLQRAMAVVEEHLTNPDFDVETFCREIGMSRMQLHRKIKALTDQTTTEFIRTLRLKRAAYLLEQETGNVAEIAYQVGFQNLSYFSKCFKEMYGCPPSEYLESKVGSRS